MNASVSDLPSAIVRGERWACEAFVRAAAPDMLETIRRFVRDPQQVRPALEEAFASLFRRVAETGSAPDPAMSRRAAIEAAIAHGRDRAPSAIPDPSAGLPRFDETGHRVAPRRRWRELDERDPRVHAAVRGAIESLPEGHRAVLLLRDVEGMEIAAIATMLGVTPNAIKIRVHRARQALREMLDEGFERAPRAAAATA